jgi:serine/threonine-protein kinase RsbW
MLEDRDSVPIPAELSDWAGALPWFAAETVSRADFTSPHLFLPTEARPEQVSVVRSAMIDWTRAIGFGTVQAQDIALAADEAVSNAVEHAYPDEPGALSVFAACLPLDHTARIVVADEGVWRPPPVNPGFRGRGLMLMERLGQIYRLAHGPTGTTVLLGWSLPD